MGKLQDSYRSMRQGDEARFRISRLRRIAAHSVFRTFQFDNVEHKADVEKIIEALEKQWRGQRDL